MRAVASCTRAAAACIAIVAVAVVAGGCGGRLSDSAYQRQLDKAQQARTDTLADVANHDLGDVKFFATAQSRLSQVSNQMSDLSPPHHVQFAHDKYVGALAGMARVLGKFADCARLQKTDQEGAVACRRKIDQLELDNVQNDFTEAETIYRQEGLDIAAPPSDLAPGGGPQGGTS